MIKQYKFKSIDEYPELVKTCDVCHGKGCAACCWCGKRSTWEMETVTKIDDEYERIKNKPRLTKEDIENIKILRALGVPIKEIAKEFRVTTSWIYNITSRRENK